MHLPHAATRAQQPEGHDISNHTARQEASSRGLSKVPKQGLSVGVALLSSTGG